MFGRQGIGIGSPSIGVPFQFAAPGYPFQPFAASLNPFLTGAGFGINPLASHIGGFGISPYAGLQTAGISPLPHITAGFAPTINPAVAVQLAITNPVLLSHLAQQSMAGAGVFAGQPSLAQTLGTGAGFGWTGQAGVPFGGLTNPLTQSPIGAVTPNILAQILSNPALANDPVVCSLVAQQLNPLVQSQLPIRSLVGSPQFDPFQSGIAGPVFGQGIDPYSTLVQAQLMSQQATNPLQQILRGYAGTPWANVYGTPPIGGQFFPCA